MSATFELLKVDGKWLKNKILSGEAKLKEKGAWKYCEGVNRGEMVLPAAKLPLRWQ
jgi:hypothetical protein